MLLIATNLTGTAVMYNPQAPMRGLQIMPCRSSPINSSTSGAAAEVTMGRARLVMVGLNVRVAARLGATHLLVTSLNII